MPPQENRLKGRLIPYHIESVTPKKAQALCREITADLPEYFGLPEVNKHYAEDLLIKN